MKKRVAVTLFLIGSIALNSCKDNKKDSDIKTKNNQMRDSVLIFKTDTIKSFSFESIDPETRKWKPVIGNGINYHKIDLRDKSVTFFFKTSGRNWDKRKMHFDSVSVEKTGTMFYNHPGYFTKTFLDTLSSQTIAHVLNKDQYMRFINLKKVDESELKNLKMIKKQKRGQIDESFQQKESEDFEYSAYWRKEAFKNTITFIKKRLREATPSCTMVSRSTYDANRVKYIGQQGYRIKLFVKFDCNQNYINPSYFWVNTFYLGNGNWEMTLIDQKLTH